MSNYLFLDGAMGTMLQARGLSVGERPEVFGYQHPEVLEAIHREYIEAGSQVIYADTFGANGHKLAGTGYSVAEIVAANVATARKAAEGKPVRVALDIGPIGQMLEPLGTLGFDAAYEYYREIMVVGERAGADLIALETMSDLYEVKAAVLAAKENTELPIWVTMSFEAGGRTFMGTTVSCMAVTLDGLQVDAMGINCSLGPAEILPFIKEMREWTDRPLIAKPNAGLPNPETGAYGLSAPDFAQEMEAFGELGVTILGGCCGTTPDYIRALQNLPAPAEDVRPVRRRGVCSANRMAEFGGVRVIGENINPTSREELKVALLSHDMDYVVGLASAQADAGADILDINVGLPEVDEPALMIEVVKAVQKVVNLPLQIDSSDPKAIEAGLRACNGRAIINSVNAEPAVLESVLPVARKYGAAIVALTMDRSGLPKTAEARFEFAEKILNAAEEIGIAKEDMLVDCLTLTVSARQAQAKETLRGVRMVHEQLGLHCVLGVSNISFGLPMRTNITTSFLTQAMQCGLDFPIINPLTPEIMAAVTSFRAISGEDDQCADYIAKYAPIEAEAKRNPEVKASTPAATVAHKADEPEVSDPVAAAVLKGLGGEVKRLTAECLKEMAPIDVVNEKLIPALDLVGEQYESGDIFLPQLIGAANAASEGFELVKAKIAESGGAGVSKGRLIIATVEGDIHDIGKNIVKVILENYGYDVLDLGKDVPVETVVETAVREDIKLIGLSALMTTTVVSMKRTIEALRESGHDCKVMVGGAVMTEEYAAKMGADFYSSDAKSAVDIAREVFYN